MDSPGRQLDNRIRIVTPENVAFEYRVAGPFRRLAAYLIDLAIRMTVGVLALVGLLFAFGAFGAIGIGVAGALLIFFLLEWFYGGLFEAFWNGQTPGKRVLNVRVITVEGQPINGLQAVTRNFLRWADSLPVVMMFLPTYQLGLLTAAASHRFQRLGDWAAGTMVVIEEPHRAYAIDRVGEAEAIRLASYLPANFEVNRGLARALSAYVQRRKNFSWKRRQEIAVHLGEPLRLKFGLPPGTSHDLLLCALYHRAFIAEDSVGENPFAVAPPVIGVPA